MACISTNKSQIRAFKGVNILYILLFSSNRHHAEESELLRLERKKTFQISFSHNIDTRK